MSGDGQNFEDEHVDDAALLARLSDIARAADAPPGLAFDLGRAALAWRNADSELAQLLADSALEASSVRSSASDTRLLTFEVGITTIEVQLSVRDNRRSVLGQVHGDAAAGGVVVVETDAGRFGPGRLGALGRFALDDIEGHRLRIRLESPDITAVTTVWISI
jgi:hypothetical protein